MTASGQLAGRFVRPGRALVVSEEPKAAWAERREVLGLGDHVSLICQRPNQPEWLAFASYLAQLVRDEWFTRLTESAVAVRGGADLG
jgi:hypothetical protein